MFGAGLAGKVSLLSALPTILNPLVIEGLPSGSFFSSFRLSVERATDQSGSHVETKTGVIRTVQLLAPLAEDLTYGAPYPEGGVSTEIRVGVTDLDGDAQREIVLHETRFPPLLESNNGQVVSVTYTLTGANKRATGRYVLGDANVLRAAAGSGTTEALGRGLLLDTGGDFDGDGSTDLIFGVSQDASASDSKVSLHLVPGTPRAPD